MMRLVVNAGTSDAWERVLPNGTYSLGRAPVNDIVVEHDSVSHTHCQVTVSGTQAIVKDLGSTNGTTREGQLIEEIALLPGQLFRVGEVEMQFLYRPTQSTVRPRPAPQESFFKSLPGALGYPFNGSGIMLLAGGGILFLILDFIPFIGFILTGYLFGYFQSIVASSANGEDEPPDWPDLSSPWDDLVLPLLQLVALMLLCFGPARVLQTFLPPDLGGHELIIRLANLVGVFVFPMGMLAVSIMDGFACLNPVTLVLSMARIPGHYLVAATAFGIVIATYTSSNALLASFIPSRLAVTILAGFANVYLLTVAMRILGLLYRATAERLGWFGR